MVKTAKKPKRTNKKEERKTFLSKLGPGLITGASDDDPSGIGTYAQAGAAFGTRMLWTAIYTIPLSIAIQYICAKIALVTGRGLAGVLGYYYPKWIAVVALLLLTIANTINIGADIGAIGAAVNLLVPSIPIGAVVVPAAALISMLQVFGSYKLLTNIFKWLTLSLFAYVFTTFFVQVNWQQVLRDSLIPNLQWNQSSIQMLVALIGTTISPYLFFWQTTHEVEEEKSQGKTKLEQRQGTTGSDLKDACTDVSVGMGFSNLVFYFIVITTASTLHITGKTNIQSAADAAAALKPLAGDFASVLFALGLIGTGLLAVPILSGSAAYALAEIFGWERDLNTNIRKAPSFYLCVIAVTLIGTALTFTGVNPMDALVWTAVINGVLAPPLLAMIMFVANRKDVMGDKVNTLPLNTLGWFTTVVMAIAACLLLAQW